jgi:GNAT superfamily N-acetyltransferase
MNATAVIRKYLEKDAAAMCTLVRKTFRQFISGNFTADGRKRFLDEQTKEKQNERAKPRSVYVALERSRVIGMVEATFPDRLNRLFVDKRHHGKGIGKLMERIERSFRKRGSQRLKLRSSPYAIKFYQRIGYRKTTRIIHRQGFVYQPMAKKPV